MAAGDDYRTAIGYAFGGPWERKAGDHTVYTYSFKTIGLNGDVLIKVDFWDDDPDYFEIGPAYLINGKYSVWTSPDGEKSTKTITPSKVTRLGENVFQKSDKKSAPPKKKRTPEGETPEFDF